MLRHVKAVVSPPFGANCWLLVECARRELWLDGKRDPSEVPFHSKSQKTIIRGAETNILTSLSMPVG